MKYYIIAGEASGDLHGSNLIKELKKLDDSNYIFDSFLEIKTDKVMAQNINQVEDITKAIAKFTNTKLIVKQL